MLRLTGKVPKSFAYCTQARNTFLYQIYIYYNMVKFLHIYFLVFFYTLISHVKFQNFPSLTAAISTIN